MHPFNTAGWRALRARFSATADDEKALAYGWDIERGRFGRRAYRDPRFADRRGAARALQDATLMDTGVGDTSPWPATPVINLRGPTRTP
jgi:hypothetical protein